MNSMSYDVVIVGAGAAGIGCGAVLQALGVERWTLLERQAIGASFLHWPRETRLLTPSFPSNQFGMLDLNAVALGTAPAYTLRTEHPTGAEYARYLERVADHWQLPVEYGIDVTGLRADGSGDFLLETSHGPIRSRYVVWAAGEFQYPYLPPLGGVEECVHSATIASWAEIAHDEVLIIGGFESGIDAAIHLVAQGKRVRVLDPKQPWNAVDSDPSVTLSPYTLDRLREAYRSGRLELVGGVTVAHVARQGQELLVLGAASDQRWTTPGPPILATGFAGSLGLVASHFDWHADGYALLTPDDESTRRPGLFLAGPAVRHDNAIFCFIYKFRQRFAVVGAAIADRLGLDPSPLEAYRAAGMWLDDLSCCGETCAC